MNVESWVPPLTEIIDVDAWQPKYVYYQQYKTVTKFLATAVPKKRALLLKPVPKKKNKKPLPPGQLLLTSNLSQLGTHIDQHSLACEFLLHALPPAAAPAQL
jgi:hypothetical protein